MLLRNYDNFMMGSKACGIYNNSTYAIEKILDTTNFGDGYFSVKTAQNNFYTSVIQSSKAPFRSFAGLNNVLGVVGNESSNLICSNIGDEVVTYDDYTITPISNLTFVAHSQSMPVIDEDNNIISSYSKTYYNANTEAVTINCIAVTYSPSSYVGSDILVYKEKLSTPIEVPTGANVTLTFTMKASMDSNKPTDYVATASVE